MTQRNFPKFDENTAPAAAQAPLAQTRKAFGAVPEPLARYASSPLMLETALRGLAAFEHQTTLTPLEREVLAMTMGHTHGCKFCLDFHRRALRAQHAPAPIITALEAGGVVPEPRLEALRQFVIALLRDHGDVATEAWRQFGDAGYTHQQALEVLMGVSVYTLTTLANRLTETSE
jgi:AhpD family alkylhydroperoxidase